MKPKYFVILGTRPETIKLSFFIKLLKHNGVDFKLIHTGQHYSDNMDSIFFKELELPKPDYNLQAGKLFKTPEQQIDHIRNKIEAFVNLEKPDYVVVYGDTNSSYASAVGTKNTTKAKLVHVEAGLRSFDKQMPEEHNRIAIDNLSDYLFCPTETSNQNLITEQVEGQRSVVGNTIVEVINHYKNKMVKPFSIDQPFFLLTLHRRENINDKNKIKSVVEAINKIPYLFGVQVIFPMHPHTYNKLREMNIRFDDKIKVVEPIGYFEFLWLEKNAMLCMVDSGGCQEECCILGQKCVTLRENTERPETIESNSNILVGTDTQRILTGVQQMIDSDKVISNPFGDGNTSKRIIKKLGY